MTLNFESHLEPDNTSVRRARETPSELTKLGDSWLVAFEDSDNVHEVELQQTPDGYDGVCYVVDENGVRTQQCPGFEYHDGPCAHLWLVRSETRSPPVITDGGNVDPPAAGNDSRTFGKPEMVR